MWVYTTQGIAQNIWGTTDATSNAFNEAGNWTGVIFAAYSVFAALFSLVITPLADKYGRRNVYVVSLILGGLGLLSILFIKDKNLLFLPMIGVGIAWAAILALPYAIYLLNFQQNKQEFTWEFLMPPLLFHKLLLVY